MTVTRILSFLLASSLFLSAPHARLPNKLVDEAKRAAPIHLRFDVKQVKLTTDDVGRCTIEGRVTHVYRNRTSETITRGASVSIDVYCKKPKTRTRPSGIRYLSIPALKKAASVEVFLRGQLSNPDVVNGGLKLMPKSATGKP